MPGVGLFAMNSAEVMKSFLRQKFALRSFWRRISVLLSLRNGLPSLTDATPRLEGLG